MHNNPCRSRTRIFISSYFVHWTIRVHHIYANLSPQTEANSTWMNADRNRSLCSTFIYAWYGYHTATSSYSITQWAVRRGAQLSLLFEAAHSTLGDIVTLVMVAAKATCTCCPSTTKAPWSTSCGRLPGIQVQCHRVCLKKERKGKWWELPRFIQQQRTFKTKGNFVRKDCFLREIPDGNGTN